MQSTQSTSCQTQLELDFEFRDVKSDRHLRSVDNVVRVQFGTKEARVDAKFSLEDAILQKVLLRAKKLNW